MDPQRTASRHLKDLDAEELDAWLTEHHEPAYRAKQITGWLYRHWCMEIAQMTNLSQGLRQMLAADFHAFALAAIDTYFVVLYESNGTFPGDFLKLFDKEIDSLSDSIFTGLADIIILEPGHSAVHRIVVVVIVARKNMGRRVQLEHVRHRLIFGG